jgi:hypothetical protein
MLRLRRRCRRSATCLLHRSSRSRETSGSGGKRSASATTSNGSCSATSTGRIAGAPKSDRRWSWLMRPPVMPLSMPRVQDWMSCATSSRASSPSATSSGGGRTGTLAATYRHRFSSRIASRTRGKILPRRGRPSRIRPDVSGRRDPPIRSRFLTETTARPRDS